MRRRSSLRRSGSAKPRWDRRERLRVSETIAAIAVIFGLLGWLGISLGGAFAALGGVLIALGVSGLAQAVALALGIWTPRGGDTDDDGE